MNKTLLTLVMVLAATMSAQAKTIVTVAQDGSGDFTTIQAAIDAAPEGEATTIRIKAGTYDERLTIGTKQKASTKRLSLIGDGMDQTVITSSVGMAKDNTTFDQTPALSVYADDFYAQDLTLQNTAGRQGGQALALYVAGDRQTYYRCRISGYQDTHRSKKNTRSYYKDCTLEGATDFIYAGGTCWFEHCTLTCVGGGYITAPEDIVAYVQGEQKRIYLGFLFNNCTVRLAQGVSAGSVYLGRCWGASKCGSIFMKCNLGNAVHAAGWQEMGGNTGRYSYYAEYRNTDAQGSLVNTSSRIAWSYQMSDADYARVSSWTLVDQAYLATVGGSVSYDPEQVIADRLAEAAEDDYAPLEQRLLAFPTARGFGKLARGGRGGKVVEVTNLDDSGEGSLRWALSEGKENATIVFRVSGTITLKSDIRAKLKNVTIAGQTAPGMGILYRGAKLNLGGSSNLIVRNLRGRLGKTDDGGFIDGGSIGIENADSFIIDHCCFGWSGEENMTIYDNHFSTVQWTIVHEGLYNAGHAKGARGYGSQWGGSPATYHHNLLAHNVSRSPRINGASNPDQDRNVLIEYFNNVNYNWGSTGACYGGENEAGGQSSHDCNFIGNYYKPGPGSPTSGNVFISISKNRDGKTSTGPSWWYITGNKMEGNTGGTANNWNAVKNNSGYALTRIKSDTLIATQRYYWPRANKYVYTDFLTPTETADEAYGHVLARVGTVNRDMVEQRIIDEVTAKTALFQGASKKGKGFIDSSADAEGYPDYPAATAPRDDDHDGMADEWESAHGLNPSDPDDRNAVVSAEGYTALEVYLCSLMGEHIEMTKLPSALQAPVASPVVATRYYSVQGTRQGTLRPGLNLVREQLADGTVRTRKVIAK